MDALMRQVKDPDVAFHSHPEQRVMMSIDNYDGKRYSGDLSAFITEYFADGIKKQFIAAQRDV